VFACLAGLGVRDALRRHDKELDRQEIKQGMKDAWLWNNRVAAKIPASH
jgi:hypothetical protein